MSVMIKNVKIGDTVYNGVPAVRLQSAVGDGYERFVPEGTVPEGYVPVGTVPEGYVQTPTGTLQVTSNGLHGVSQYANVQVDVPPPAGWLPSAEVGVYPVEQAAYTAQIVVPVNTEYHIGVLTGDLVLTFGAATAGMSAEYVFYITQGETAHEVTLPAVEWVDGFAPDFPAGVAVECRCWVVGDIVKGVWL